MEFLAGLMILVWVLAFVNLIGTLVGIFSSIVNEKLSVGWKFLWILICIFVPFGWVFYFGLREKTY